VATPVAEDGGPRPSLDMDWDDEELATQVYDKPNEILGYKSADPRPPEPAQPMGFGGPPGQGQPMMQQQPGPATPQPMMQPGPSQMLVDPRQAGMQPSGPPSYRSDAPPTFAAPSFPISEPRPQPVSVVKARPETRRTGAGAIIGIAIALVLLVVGLGGGAFWYLTRPGGISGSVRPSIAQIRLDDRSVLVNPDGSFNVGDLAPGTYNLSISAPSFVPRTETVVVEAGAMSPLAIVLDAAAPIVPQVPVKTGVAVLVRPEGAKIFINNEQRPEVTPAEFIDLPPGMYSVRVEKESYLPLNDQVTVTQGVVSPISRQLQPENVTVTLALTPSKAKCTLFQEGQDGESVGETFKVMPHRNPRLECKASGFEPHSAPITLPPDGALVASLNVSLLEKGGASAPLPNPNPEKVRPPRQPDKVAQVNQPDKVPPQQPDKVQQPEKTPPQSPTKGAGYLSVNTRPWTKVYVDGRFIRNTPLMRHELPSGAHRLTLINEDFNIRETVPVQIKAGENTAVVRNLVSQ
jgi:hypothetical protein